MAIAQQISPSRTRTSRPLPTLPGIKAGAPPKPVSSTALSGTALARADSLRLKAKSDSATQSANSFATTVKYSSKDSSHTDAPTKTIELYGEAEVTYGDISLKADYIRLDMRTNEVYAKGRYDSTTKKWIGQPIFQDKGEKYDTKEIRYNFKTKKGLIQGVITQQGEGNIRGKVVKKDAEDNLYIRGSIYTTCNLATPHFHINAPKLKVVKNKQVVAGPFNLVINQIPLPIGLPFGFFPFPKKKDIGVSGILVPQYGEEPNGRGFYLRNGGYYWAVNENIGLQFTGQIYSRGSWGLGTSGAYNKRYRYAGGFNLQFNRNRSGDRVDTTQTPRTDFSINWSHSPQNIGKRSSFSANVNVSSNSYNQFNTFSTQQYISNVAGSSVQYSRTFGQYVRAGANFRVNQQFGQVNPVTGLRSNGKTDVSTDFNVGVNQISPFALKGGTGRWFESFRVGLDVSGSAAISNTIRRQVDTTGLGFKIITTVKQVDHVTFIRDSLARADSIRRGLVRNTATYSLPTDPNLIAFSLANAGTIWGNRVVQARYSIPISLPNIKLFRYLNITPGFSLSGDIYTKKLSYEYDRAKDAVKIDTARGIYASYNFSVSASMNTRAYGTYFIRGKRLEAIRHTIAPSISFSYVPNFADPAFGMFTRLPAEGSLAYLPEYRRTLSRFRGLGGSGGGASTSSAFISFGFVNQLEAKVRTRDDSTGQEFKKIPLLDNISLTGSYNLLAPDYKLSPLNLSANTQIFKNVSLNFSSTFDPYAYQAYGGTGVYFYPTTATGSQYLPVVSGNVQQPTAVIDRQYQRVPNLYSFQAGQGLLRMTSMQVYVSTRFAPKQAGKPKQAAGTSDATLKAINQNADMYVDFNIPWSINVNYTLGVNKLTPVESQTVQSLQLTGDFSLTPKWKFTFSTGYDFKYKSPTLTTVGVNRDLHCWEMSFNWTPFAGSQARASNYSFDLRARSAILQELKLSRRRSFYDSGGFGGTYR